MARFRYSALKNSGQIISGEIEAANLSEAKRKITKLGLILKKISESSSKDKTQMKKSALNLSQKIAFTAELQTLLSAGISILESLNSMKLHAPNEKIKTVCKKLQQGIESGMTFADTLTVLYKETFGPVYISIVKAGENSGELENALERILILLRKQDALKHKVISASIYPSILLVMMIGTLIIFSAFVFPRIMASFFITQAELPFSTRLLINMGNYILISVLITAIAVFTAVKMFRTTEFKKRFDKFVLRIPFVKDFVRCMNLSNFITVLYISYEAGLSVSDGMELGYKTVKSYIIKSQITDAIKIVQEGKSLTSALKSTNLISSDALSIVSAGEKGGALGKMLHNVANLFDKKVDMTLEVLAKLLEPAILTITGVIIGIIVIGFIQGYYGAIFNF